MPTEEGRNLIGVSGWRGWAFLLAIKRHYTLGTKDTVEVEGEVLKNFPNAQFRVKLDSGQEIMAHLSGRMRVHRIRLLPGDRVKVALSPYDMARGRVVLRLES